ILRGEEVAMAEVAVAEVEPDGHARRDRAGQPSEARDDVRIDVVEVGGEGAVQEGDLDGYGPLDGEVLVGDRGRDEAKLLEQSGLVRGLDGGSVGEIDEDG